MQVITSAIKSTVTFKILSTFLCSLISAEFMPINVISAKCPLEFLSFRASLNWLYIFLFNSGLLVVILLSLSLKSVIIVSYAILAPFKNSFCASSSKISTCFEACLTTAYFKILSN